MIEGVSHGRGEAGENYIPYQIILLFSLFNPSHFLPSLRNKYFLYQGPEIKDFYTERI